MSVFDLPGVSENIRPVMVFTEYGGSDLFVCYVANMFAPPVYLVAGDSWEDAYENFLVIPRVERELAISDVDMPDYDPENLRYNDNGTAIDDEACQCVGPVAASWFGEDYAAQGPEPS